MKLILIVNICGMPLSEDIKTKTTQKIDKSLVLTTTINLISLALAVEAFMILITSPNLNRDWPIRLISYLIYGFGLMVLYAVSAVYHLIPKTSRLHKKFQNLDFSAIFLLIASCYTPLCFLVLNNSLGFATLIMVWALALVGIVDRLTWNKIPAWLVVFIYLLMGWLVFFSLPYLVSLNWRGLVYLFAMGVFYSFSLIFIALQNRYRKNKVFNMHDIFHFFINFGSLMYFLMLVKYI